MAVLGNRGPLAPRDLGKPNPVFRGPLDSHPAFQRPVFTAQQVKAANPTARLNQTIAGLERHERASPKGMAQAAAKSRNDVAAVQRYFSHPQSGAGHPGGIMGAITNLAGEPARVISQGYKNLAVATGIPVFSKVGNVVAEGVNIPTQALPAAYNLGHALGNAGKGHPEELHELSKQFMHESAIAHLIKGDFAGAARAAGAHPLNTALEVSGGAAAVDRALGWAGRLSKADAAALADKGATNISREPRPLPATHAPEGGVTVPQRPYDKGLVRAKLERKLGAGEVSQAKASTALKRNYDQFEAEQLSASRATREMVSQRHGELLRASRTRPIPGKGAVRPFTLGLMADPKVLDEAGQPLYRTHLAEAIEHFSQVPKGELPDQALTREATVAHLRDLQNSQKFEANPHAAYQAAGQIAKDKAALEPELKQHRVYTGDTIRAAKLVPAFRFHFRNQDPFVDTSVPKGESPFYLGGAAPITTDSLRSAFSGIHDPKTGARYDNLRVHPSDSLGRTEIKADIVHNGKKVGRATRWYHANANALVREVTHVDPAFQRRGIASGLQRAEEQAAQRLGIGRIESVPITDAGKALAAKGSGWRPVPGVAGRIAKDLPTAERRQVPIDEVVQKLEAKGIHENQLAFATTKPHQSETAAFRTGRSAGGARESHGHLTGYAFARGQVDMSPESLLRQHLTDAGIINKARGDIEFPRRYVLKNEDVAKLIERHWGDATPEQRAALKDYISTELRGGKDLYFNQKGQTTPWARAQDAMTHLKALGVDLRPIRVAHQFATKEYRAALGKHIDLAATQDRLNPENFNPEGSWQTRLPTEESAQHDVSAGPVGLVHPALAQKVAEYEKDLGQAHLGRSPGSFWRKLNVADSIRHVPGVVQEVGIRAGANNVGPFSFLRGRNINEFLKDYVDQHPDPQVKLGYQRLQHAMGGTTAALAASQAKHIPFRQLEGTVLERPAKWWVNHEAQPLTGPPLKAVRGAVQAMNKGTNFVLRTERNLIEHPPQVAGAGKHFNEEFKRISGKRLSVIKSFNEVEKAFLRGQLDPKAIDHFAHMSKEYWGEWQASSPKYRELQKFMPFARWYQNSLRFVYATMPAHHPLKTGLLSVIEQATQQKREAEGQGYHGALKLLPGELSASQQGSIPLGKGRASAQYYTPPGAVSGGLEGLLGSLLPYVSGAWEVAHGHNPVTGKELTETVNGKKRPITDGGKLAMLAAISAAESFLPPIRYATQLQKKPASYVFRPFKTEKTRLEGSKAELAKLTAQGPEVREARGAGESQVHEGSGARETR